MIYQAFTPIGRHVLLLLLFLAAIENDNELWKTSFVAVSG